MSADEKFIPFALPDIGEEEINEVVACLRSGWLTTGPKTIQFQKDFASYIGAPHAIAVNSATSGLHLALEALGVGPGDKVVTTPFTFTATAEVIRYLGADPLFVDIDPCTLNIDPDLVGRAVSRNPEVKAVMPVHLAGQACDLDPIMAAARRHGLPVLEDAAHALPTTYKGRMIGTISDITVFSFYATKTMTTGEGGMVVTARDDLARRMELMRFHGINREVWDRYTSDKPKWFYEVVEPGYKYNMSDIMAAIGIHQLRKLDGFQARRAAIAARYNEAFADLPVTLPHVADPADRHAWHMYVLQLDLDRLNIGRDEFIIRLAALGVGANVHYTPLHTQPYWRDRYGFQPGDFPAAEEAYRRVVSIPLYTGMTDADVERVVDAVKVTLTEVSR